MFGIKKPAAPPAASLATAPAAGADGDLIKDTTTKTFAKDVMEASRTVPVIVDFWAPWCEPCKQMTPVLEKVVRAAKGAVRLVKMNIDEHPSIAQQLRVQSIPAVFAFVDGRPVDGFMGALPESQIKDFINRVLGEGAGLDAGLEEALLAAAQAFDAGDLQGAAETYAEVLQEDKQNVEALAGLARCYLKTGDTERAEQTLALVPPDKQNAQAVTTVRAAIELARKSANAGDLTALTARVEADPKDFQARFDLAVALAAHDQREPAVDQLLEIMRRNRPWNEEAARKQLIELFEAWGPKDPVTIDGRRRLAAVLFA